MNYKSKYRRYYIRPTGNVIYDEWGILYPQRQNINIFSLINSCGGRKIKWTKNISWGSQKEYLTFYASISGFASLSIRLMSYPLEVVNLWVDFREMVKNGKIDRIIIKERQLLNGDKELADRLSRLADIADGVDNYVYSG